MLSVTLTLTDTDQSTKLLALLESLPFVEVQNCQPLAISNELELTEIFSRYLKYCSFGFTSHIWTGTVAISVFNGINDLVQNELGTAEEKALYLALGEDPGIFEGQLITCGEREAYCVYRRGYRVLYEVDAENKMLHVFHVTKAAYSAS